MMLWQMEPAELVLTLDHLVTLGEHPEDPYEALVFFEYLKVRPTQEQIEKADTLSYAQALRDGRTQPDLRFVALLLELRRLERATPLRHRGFSQVLQRLKPAQGTLAIRSMVHQAVLGDRDALWAIVRAALESSDEQVREVLYEALSESKPSLQGVEDFLVLYEQDSEFAAGLNAFRQTFFPPIPELIVHLPPLPPVPIAKKTPQKRRWSACELDGPGFLVVASSSGALEKVWVTEESLSQLPDGYRYSAFQGRAQSSRRITGSKVSDDLSLIAVFFSNGSLDLVNRRSGKRQATLGDSHYTCFARRGSRILLSGPSGLTSQDSRGAFRTITTEPVRAFGPGGVLVHQDGVVSVKGRERFQIDPTYQLRLAPQANSLALWNRQGEVEVFDLQGELLGRFFAGDDNLSYSLESDQLVLAEGSTLKRWSLDGKRLPALPLKGPAPRRSPPAPQIDEDHFFERHFH